MTGGGFERRLKDFGFSEKEAAVYGTLLRLGEAKPSQIASTAEVSTRYVYAVGERLEKRGFVTVNDHVTPTVMRALPPEEVIEGLRAELADLETSLRSKFEAPDQAEMSVEVLKTTMTLRKRLRTHIDRAAESVVLSIPAVALADIAAELREARERDVLVQLVLDRSMGIPAVSGLADLVRTRPRGPLAMAAIDGTTGLVTTSEMLERSNSGDQAFLCSDRQMGQLLVGGFMGTIWLVADEHFTREPAALPATYTSIYQAIVDAALYQRHNTEIHAEITGYNEEHGGSVELDGPVVDVRQAFVEPATGRRPTEAVLVIETTDGTVEVAEHQSHADQIEPTEVTFVAA